jgi:dipeptide transport system permease protein
MRDTHPLADFWAAFRENRGAVAGLAVVLTVVVLAIFAPLIAPYDPDAQFRDAIRAAPFWEPAAAPASCWAPTAWAATCSPA